ncbi:MAG: 30S ribosomal protein S17 [Candidatus Marinimicrobia bacterium]|nr:30S ribosomal protein S17 [Candidatus Neomarinimicrobiota bacterium]
MSERGKAQVFEGKVVSNRMEKTVVVEVSRRVKHPVYKKFITRKKKFKAHASDRFKCDLGDYVRIISSRPISKTKHWRVLEILERSKGV